jgi:tetratricopeptide (TPR) repeat protein
MKPPPELLPGLQAAVIIVSTMVIYWPALHGGWLWDDNVDITENLTTKGARGLWNIWFEPGTQPDYYPIKASVQWAQWHLWGADTFGYHVTNVMLHIASALLVWRLFDKLGLRLAWLGGLIFAVHPVQVESVAWIAELKNALAMPFFLLAAIFYLEYDGSWRRSDLAVSLGWFVLAMLTKPTMVMFPVAILGYAWWKRGGVGREDFMAGVPFFAVSLVLGAVTLAMEYWYKHLHHQEMQSIPVGGFFSRAALMGLTLAFYAWKAVWPAGFSPIYPQWPVNPPSLWQFLPWPVLGGLLFWLWTKRQSWGRGVLFGFGFFLIMLAPFSGLMPASFMTFTWVMDHFLYIPILGLIGPAIAGLERLEQKAPKPARFAGVGLLTVILAAMIATSRNYAKKFESGEALWSYTLTRYPNCWEAHNNLGIAVAQRGEVDEALDQFQKALALNPRYAEARYNLGLAFAQKGRIDDAMAQYQKALDADPNIAQAHNNLGNAFLQKGNLDQAIAQYQSALAIDPNIAQARNNLGDALLRKGEMDEAVAQYQKALAIDSGIVQAHRSLGIILLRKGRWDEAIAQFQEVLRLNPGSMTAQEDLAQAESLAQKQTNRK